MKFNSCGGILLFFQRIGFPVLGNWKVGRRLQATIPLNKTILRAMKLVMILLVAACLHVSAKTHAQKVTFSGANVGLQTIFDAIQQQTGIGVFMEDGLLKQTKHVTVELKDASVEEALRICFKSQPIALDFWMVGRSIIVKKKIEVRQKEPPTTVILSGDTSRPQPIDIHGQVTDSLGNPLAGASVTVKRNRKGGTQTNLTGDFYLASVTPTDILTISYTGYKEVNLKIQNRIDFKIVLELFHNELDDVVVQAYGTTTRRLNTGNIGTVSAAVIGRQPVSNVLEALEGQVPGLNISQSSGYVSAPYKVDIRGRNGIADQFTDPLYIVDGVPFFVGGYNFDQTSVGSSLTVSGLTGPSSGQSPLYSINPADIESVEVLKDADATAIYGSRASNGVILITTKKGKTSGKAQLTANIYSGVNKVSRYYNLLNTRQYVAIRKEALTNDGLPVDQDNAPDLTVWDTTRYANWQKLLFGGTGHVINAQLSVSGGGKQTTFRISGGFSRSTDILTVSGANQLGSLAFNLNSFLTPKFTVGFSGNYSSTAINEVNQPGNAILLPPNAPSIYDSSGNLNWSGWQPLTNLFPFGQLLRKYTSNTNNLISSLSLNYIITHDLTARTVFGYTDTRVQQVSMVPSISQNPGFNPSGYSNFGNIIIKNWNIEPQVEYNKLQGRGKLNILIGTTLQENTTSGTWIQASGFSSDALLGTMTAASTLYPAADNYAQYRYAGLFGRINYNFKDEYIINLSGRRDGSSRFGADKQYGNFGAIGAAWIFSQETLFKRSLGFLSFGKIRGSYGITGGDGIGDYQYLSTWQGATPYQGNATLYPTQLYNPNFHWETNKKLEGAIELGFLNDRVNLAVSIYQNRCNNQLVSYLLPYVTGFSGVTNNFPALVQNSGVEILFGAKIIDNRDFKWSLNANISLNRNKLIAFPNLDQTSYAYTLQVGQPLNITKLLHFTGVDPKTGKYTFQDKNKDGNITYNDGIDDDTYPNDLTPKFSGGIGNNITWKGFQINFFFRFIKQKGYNYLRSSGAVITYSNFPLEILKRWQKPGDITDVAALTTQYTQENSNYSVSDAGLSDASFIRLQNLSLSYSLSADHLKKVKITGVTIYLRGENLFTITNYKGVDPETQNFGALPPMRVFTGGVQITL